MVTLLQANTMIIREVDPFFCPLFLKLIVIAIYVETRRFATEIAVQQSDNNAKVKFEWKSSEAKDTLPIHASVRVSENGEEESDRQAVLEQGLFSSV